MATTGGFRCFAPQDGPTNAESGHDPDGDPNHDHEEPTLVAVPIATIGSCPSRRSVAAGHSPTSAAFARARSTIDGRAANATATRSPAAS